MSELYPLNDLSSEESPLYYSDQPLAATSVVTDENVLLDGNVNEEDKSARNKVTEAAGVHVHGDDQYLCTLFQDTFVVSQIM